MFMWSFGPLFGVARTALRFLDFLLSTGAFQDGLLGLLSPYWDPRKRSVKGPFRPTRTSLFAEVQVCW